MPRLRFRRNHPLPDVLVTNSLPQYAALAAIPNLRVLDVSPLFAEAIQRVHSNESIASLFGRR